MNRIIFSLLLSVVVIFSVDAQKRKETVNTPVGVSYCLPKVSYKVKVTLECTQLIPGPYRKYAEKELGVKPEIQAAGEIWNIKDIRIQPQYVPDEKAVYSISASGEYHPVMLNLTAEGFLAGITGGQGGIFNEELKMTYKNDDKVVENVIDIMNLNTYNHLKEVLDSNFTYQEVDKVMKKIWDPIVRYAPKTEQDNVKEAVSEIFRLRSERVKLLSAGNDVPDGKSLEIILKGFEKMEENYLSLFMGKKEKQTVVRTFECQPEKAGEPVVLFRFSEETGVTGVKNVSATPYSLQIQDIVVPAPQVANAPAANATQPAVYYRVPAVGELKLMKSNEELISFRTIVPQFGEIKRFPTDIIINEGLVIEFYPQFGSLKSIRK